jgi:hypothetical protein
MGSILGPDVGHVEEEFNGAPVIEIKVKTILRMCGTHLRGGAVRP